MLSRGGFLTRDSPLFQTNDGGYQTITLKWCSPTAKGASSGEGFFFLLRIRKRHDFRFCSRLQMLGSADGLYGFQSSVEMSCFLGCFIWRLKEPTRARYLLWLSSFLPEPFYLSDSAHMVTPAEVNSRPSACLANFILSGSLCVTFYYQ